MHSTFEAKNLFDPSDREMLAFRHWPIEGSDAGLQTYIVSERFVDKMQEFLAAHGSDMIDAYLYGNLCQNEYKSPEERDKLWAMNYMSQHAQKAPHSSADGQGYFCLTSLNSSWLIQSVSERNFNAKFSNN